MLKITTKASGAELMDEAPMANHIINEVIGRGENLERGEK